MSKIGSIILVICLLLLSQGYEITQSLWADCVQCDSSGKAVFPTETEMGLAIERAARRTDQKLNARWTALLDSIMVEVHEQFLVEYKAELDSLKRKETIRYIKKRLLKDISAESRARADSL